MSRWKEILDSFKSLLQAQELEEQRKKNLSENNTVNDSTPTQNPRQRELSNKILHLMKGKGAVNLPGKNMNKEPNQTEASKPSKPKRP